MACLVLMTAGSAWAQGFGSGSGQSALPAGILKFSLFGKDWVNIVNFAKTADNGAVGSDGFVQMGQGVIVRGNILAIGEVIGGHQDLVTGNISSDSIVNFGNLLHVDSSIWTGDSLLIGNQVGIDGRATVGSGMVMGYYDTIRGLTTLANGVIPLPGAWTNVFGSQGLIDMTPPYQLIAGVNTADSIRWNTPFARPAQWDPVAYNIPTTTVNFDGTKNCSLAQNLTWDNTGATCVLVTGPAAATLDTAPDGAKVLPPGDYGDMSFAIQSKLVLGEGIYHFKSFTLNTNNNNDIRMPVWQPTGGRTQILVDSDVLLQGNGFMLRPAATVADYNEPRSEGVV